MLKVIRGWSDRLVARSRRAAEFERRLEDYDQRIHDIVNRVNILEAKAYFKGQIRPMPAQPPDKS